jgi:hypothetical protein
MMNDFDIKNLKFEKDLYQKYEKLSLENAIAQMDDMGWCPIPGCSQLAHIEKELNIGRCTFCELVFCLDCRQNNHPFRRCKINRLDLVLANKENDQINKMMNNNKSSEDILSKLFIKHCTKQCPNPKCGVPIIKAASGCTHI